MNVYMKNTNGEQTVRWLPIHKAIGLRFYVFIHYHKSVRPIIRFVI